MAEQAPSEIETLAAAFEDLKATVVAEREATLQAFARVGEDVRILVERWDAIEQRLTRMREGLK